MELEITAAGASVSAGQANLGGIFFLSNASGASISAGSAGTLGVVHGRRVTALDTLVDAASGETRVTEVVIEADGVNNGIARVTELGLTVDALHWSPPQVTELVLKADAASTEKRVTALALQVDGVGGQEMGLLNCWEFHVYDRWGVYLAYLDGATDKAYAVELNQPGAGSFKLHSRDPKATPENLKVGNLVMVRYRNVDIGGFTIDSVSREISSEVDFWYTVTGRGFLGTLDWAMIYPTDSEPDERTFTGQTRAGILLQLYNEFVLRGGGMLSPDFSAQNDSLGGFWPDTNSLKFRVGDSVLSAAQQLCALGMDLYVTPQRVLRAVPLSGSDKQNEILFVLGKNLLTWGRDLTATELVNAVYGVAEDATLETVESANIAEYGRRESMLQAGNMVGLDQLQAATQRLLTERGDVQTSLKLTVALDEYFPVLDYNLGDVVRIDIPGIVDAGYRIWGLSIREKDSPCNLEVELEVGSLLLDYQVRLARAFDASQQIGIGPAASTQLASGSTTPPGSAVKLQGYSVSTTPPDNGQALLWNAGAAVWEPGTVSGGGGEAPAALKVLMAQSFV